MDSNRYSFQRLRTETKRRFQKITNRCCVAKWICEVETCIHSDGPSKLLHIGFNNLIFSMYFSPTGGAAVAVRVSEDGTLFYFYPFAKILQENSVYIVVFSVYTAKLLVYHLRSVRLCKPLCSQQAIATADSSTFFEVS